MLVAGTVGNAMNIFIFSSVRTYRRTPCTFFFLAASIDDIIYILINLTIFIIIAGFGFNFAATSTFWCKIRPLIITTQYLISITCITLATVEQYFATSRIVFFRRCSNIKWAHRILYVIIVAACIYGSPYLLYYNISPISQTCVITNDSFRNFVSVAGFIIATALPVVLMIIFGYLAYRNIHETIVLAKERADRQLTKMVLIQVLIVLISNVPYCIATAYFTITAGVVKDFDRQMKEYFALTIISLTSYLCHSVCLIILS